MFDASQLAKQGGTVLAVGVLTYMCGNEYYMSVFHDCNVGLFLFVPFESAVGEGILAIVAVGFVSALAAALGFTIGRRVTRRSRALLVGTLPIAVGLGYYIAQIASLCGISVRLAPGLPIASVSRFTIVSSLATAAVFVLASIKGAINRQLETSSESALIQPQPRILLPAPDSTLKAALRFVCVITVVLLVYSSFYYSALRGRTLVLTLDSRTKAHLVLSDLQLQQQFSSTAVTPLFDTPIDSVFIYNTDRNERKIIVFKKSFVSSIVFR